MTCDEPQNSRWTDADIDAIFSAIGRYFVIFQSLEGKLDEILLLGWGHEDWTKRQTKLANMSNVDKVNLVRELVLSSPDFSRVHRRPEWCEDFEQTIQRLHDERRRRNGLVHSQYLFDFVEIGYPPLRSLRRRGNSDLRFDQEYITKAALNDTLRKLIELMMDVNFLYVQLVHDYNSR